MKPARFDYYSPDSPNEALELLGQYGDDAKILAGGQSLMPTLSFHGLFTLNELLMLS